MRANCVALPSMLILNLGSITDRPTIKKGLRAIALNPFGKPRWASSNLRDRSS
jgi:hypothetical protein